MTNPTGLRATSAETLAATNYARQYDEASRITRSAALRVAKLAAAAMGLKSAKIAMIDQLFACSKPADWQGQAAPVVWPSNARLARSLGISISTMKHHLNGLVRAGLIAYSDSPTYQRSGRRDAEGNIVEAAGINLSPIAVRFAELTEMVEAADHAARQSQKLSYQRTIVRKHVQSILLAAGRQGLQGDWGHYQARLDVLNEIKTFDLNSRTVVVADLEQLQSEVEQAFETANEDMNFEAALSKFRPILTTAESHNSESSNQMWPRANAREPISSAASGSMALEKKPGGNLGSRKEQKKAQAALTEDLNNISLDLIEAACPAFGRHASGAFDSWWNLKEAGRGVALGVGINPQVWQEAVAVLGSDLAVAALAVTLQKSDTGLVSKPGAYLRTLVQRGRTGELHISRSLFGLAQLADPVAAPAAPTRLVFPDIGSVHFSPWAEVIRTHAPKPTPDVDLVANAFRRWSRQRDIDLSGANIESVLIGFCKKWRNQT